MGVAACEIDGIARISPLEHVGDKRLPALIGRLMTEGEARPNGALKRPCSLPLAVKAGPPCRCHANLDINSVGFGMLAEWFNATVPKAVAL